MLVHVRRAKLSDIPTILYLNEKYIEEKYTYLFLQQLFEESVDHFVVEKYLDREQEVASHEVIGKEEFYDEININHVLYPQKELEYFIDDSHTKINHQRVIVGYILADTSMNEIIQVCIKPDHRNQGLATLLIKNLFTASQTSEFSLFVRIDNAPAYNLYLKRFDGHIITVIPDYYDDSPAFLIKIQNKYIS